MDEEIQVLKSRIRKEVLQKRNSLDNEFRKFASVKLADRIIGHQWFYGSDTIMIFASYGSEIDTSEIILEALRTDKKVYVPKVEGNEINFYRIWSMEQLNCGYKGIPEPDTDNRFQYSEDDMSHTLMIMPGVAFDVYRNRIGYGKGFYDRYLSDKQSLQLRTIAVGFLCQQVEEIPSSGNDIKPYQVILV